MKKLVLLALVLGLSGPWVFGQILPPITKQISISGTVMDDPYPARRMSLPLKDVKVKIAPSRIYILAANQVDLIGPYPLPTYTDSAITDVGGKFAFNKAVSGMYDLTFENPLYASKTISLYAANDTAITVLLVSAGAKTRFTGTVTAACSNILGMPCILTPLAGCTVSVFKSTLVYAGISSNFVMPTSNLVFKAVTNASGVYSVDSVPVTVNGEYVTVSATKAGYVGQTVDTTIRNMQTTTLNFSLLPDAIALKDTVYVQPPHPTSLDSLTFTLRNGSDCCAMKYRDKTVQVYDTAIYLSYTYDDSMCQFVNCFINGSSTIFKSKPVAAGRYGIYQAGTPYCRPGTICPMVKIAPSLVGTVTVTRSAAVLPMQGGTVVRGNSLFISGNIASVTIARSAFVTLRVFDLRGRLVSEAFNARLPGGTSHFNVGVAGAQGACVLTLTVDGVKTSMKTIVPVW